ncbi:hypothetical protein B0J17DRAFT_393889 [Rhizoctonia solani]|nr:hypothetical protein B0J17DRAFT_393889 [Rhizoctonia solani]
MTIEEISTSKHPSCASRRSSVTVPLATSRNPYHVGAWPEACPPELTAYEPVCSQTTLYLQI